MPPIRLLDPLLVAIVVSALAAAPVRAETIYLKNGTQITGTIVKEDAASFAVETPQGRRKVPKQDVAICPPPNPTVALVTGILLAGGGNFYVGTYDRAALYLGMGAATGAIGYFATRQIRPSSPSTAAVAAIILYFIPALVGAMDALGMANDMQGLTRYHIDYNQ